MRSRQVLQRLNHSIQCHQIDVVVGCQTLIDHASLLHLIIQMFINTHKTTVPLKLNKIYCKLKKIYKIFTIIKLVNLQLLTWLFCTIMVLTVLNATVSSWPDFPILYSMVIIEIIVDYYIRSRIKISTSMTITSDPNIKWHNQEPLLKIHHLHKCFFINKNNIK